MKNMKRVWQLLLDWEAAPVLYLITVFAINLVSNAIYSLLTASAPGSPDAAPQQNEQVVIVAAMGSVVATLALYLLFRRVHNIVERLRSPPVKQSANEAFQVPRQGLILTIGGQIDTPKFALDNQKPTWVGLVCTTKTESVARQIAQSLRTDAGEERARVWPVSNANDVLAMKSATVSLARWLMDDKKLTVGAIVIDITGGTKPMSIGAFLAAQELSLDTQYVSSEFVNNKPVPNTQDEILISPAI